MKRATRPFNATFSWTPCCCVRLGYGHGHLPRTGVPDQVRMVEDMISLEQAEVVIQGVASAETVALSSIALASKQGPKPVVQLEVPRPPQSCCGRRDRCLYNKASKVAALRF